MEKVGQRGSKGSRGSKDGRQSYEDKKYQERIKVLILGDTGVGKTSLIKRYIDNQFLQTYVSTIGVDFKEKKIEMKGKAVRMQIWDTAGQERFHTITKAYYRGAHGLVIAFSLIDRNSFEHIDYWLKGIEDSTDNLMPKVIAGVKCDLAEERVVTEKEARQFSKSRGLEYVEISCKDGTNVDSLFLKLVEKVVDYLKVLVKKKEEKKMALTSKGVKQSKCAC